MQPEMNEMEGIIHASTLRDGMQPGCMSVNVSCHEFIGHLIYCEHKRLSLFKRHSRKLATCIWDVNAANDKATINLSSTDCESMHPTNLLS